MELFTLFLPPPPLIFLCVLFSNHTIIVILKVDVGSTDHLNYLPIHKTHHSVLLKFNPFSEANQSIKQPSNQNQKNRFNLANASKVFIASKTRITLSWVKTVLQSGRQVQ
jgi:hypothetical protein